MALKLTATLATLVALAYGTPTWPSSVWVSPHDGYGPHSTPSPTGSAPFSIAQGTPVLTFHSYVGCTDFFVAVPLEYEYYEPKFSPFTSQGEATELSLQFTSRTPGKPADAITGPYSGSQTFNISARYCPAKTEVKEHAGTLLLLTHGIGFDKSYWSFYYPSSSPTNYSFTYNANNAGFSTLSYDRLGTGLSTHPDPYTTVQAQVELALLKSITTAVRNGSFSDAVPKPEKVVHVGHSFGSQLSHGLISTAPALSDGVVLTGYSDLNQYQVGFVISAAFHIARLTDPTRFADLSTGYLTWGDKSYNQYSFLYYPHFDNGVLEQAEATKQPFTIGEFLTGQNLGPNVAGGFKKPVLLLAPSNDLIFCGANCTYGLIDGPAKEAFPVADLTTYIQPNTGHGINLHYNATGAYQYIFDWLSAREF